jgi:hypothetical protein
MRKSSIMNFKWSDLRTKTESRRKLSIFILCLLFSFVAWLSIKLSRESALIFPVEIQITNIPDNAIIVDPSDTVMLVTMQSTGLRFLTSRFFSSKRTLNTDFNLLQRRSHNNQVFYFLTSTQAEIRFAVLNDIPRTSIRVEPDTLFFTVQEAFQKKVPVIINSQIQYTPGFNIYNEPVITPDSVFVSGPMQYKDSVEFVITEPFVRQGVFQPIRVNLGLINNYHDRGVVLSSNNVDVQIPVEEFTESTVELTLSLDCPETVLRENATRIILLPEKVTVHYLVALKDDKSIETSMFKAYVKCPDSIPENQNRLKPQIAEKPDLVEILRIRPAEIEFIILK